MTTDFEIWAVGCYCCSLLRLSDLTVDRLVFLTLNPLLKSGRGRSMTRRFFITSAHGKSISRRLQLSDLLPARWPSVDVLYENGVIDRYGNKELRLINLSYSGIR